MKFNDLRSQIRTLQNEIQEIQSTCYVLFPVEGGYQFIAYYDLDAHTLGYTVVNSSFVEIKLLSDLPTDVLVGFGKFVEMLEQWQNDETLDFPFAQHVTDSVPELRTEFDSMPSDENLDGEEAELT